MEPCICAVGDLCPRYKIRMTANRHAACAGTNDWPAEKREKYLAFLLGRAEGRKDQAEDRVRRRRLAGIPGTKLKQMFAEVGANPDTEDKCGCKELAEWMDDIGINGCKKFRESTAFKIKQNFEKLSEEEKQEFAVRAMTSSWAAVIDPTDLFGSMIDEAIRRAEAETD